MDLIDRDELRMVVYATERCNGKTALIEAISTIINSAHTVDAIPIEWIKEWTNKNQDLVSETVFELLEWMLEDWRKKQEKQNET